MARHHRPALFMRNPLAKVPRPGCVDLAASKAEMVAHQNKVRQQGVVGVISTRLSGVGGLSAPAFDAVAVTLNAATARLSVDLGFMAS